MNNNILHLDSIIESTDKYNEKRVSDIIENKREWVFQMLKKGYRFDDEVLKKAHIKHETRDHKIELIISDHAKDNKTYKKDTATFKEIIKEIDVLEYDDETEPPITINQDEKTEETDESIYYNE